MIVYETLIIVLLTLSEHRSSLSDFSWFHVVQSLVLLKCGESMFLFFCPFLFWPLYCLFFDLQRLFTSFDFVFFFLFMLQRKIK